MARQKYTASDIAALCGMTRDGIHKARRRGKFPHVHLNKLVKPRGLYEFPRCDVKEFLFVEHDICLDEQEGGNEDEE